MSFEPWMLAAIDAAGYNGIRQEHIEAVACEIRSMGISNVSCEAFDLACARCGVDSGNFTSEDISALEKYLND